MYITQLLQVSKVMGNKNKSKQIEKNFHSLRLLAFKTDQLNLPIIQKPVLTQN